MLSEGEIQLSFVQQAETPLVEIEVLLFSSLICPRASASKGQKGGENKMFKFERDCINDMDPDGVLHFLSRRNIFVAIGLTLTEKRVFLAVINYLKRNRP